VIDSYWWFISKIYVICAHLLNTMYRPPRLFCNLAVSTHIALTPARQTSTGTWFSYPGWMEGWVT